MTGVINMTCGGADIEQNKRVYSKHTRRHGRGRPLGDLARRHLVLAPVPRAGVTALAQRQKRASYARGAARDMQGHAHAPAATGAEGAWGGLGAGPRKAQGRQRCNAELVMRVGGREGGRTTRLPCAAATTTPSASAAARSASSATAATAASTSRAVTSCWTQLGFPKLPRSTRQARAPVGTGPPAAGIHVAQANTAGSKGSGLSCQSSSSGWR